MVEVYGVNWAGRKAVMFKDGENYVLKAGTRVNDWNQAYTEVGTVSKLRSKFVQNGVLIADVVYKSASTLISLLVGYPSPKAMAMEHVFDVDSY